MKRARWRTRVGTTAAIVAAVVTLWLVLVVLSIVPGPKMAALNQSGIRLLAELLVGSLLVAAVSFWDD